MWLQMETKDTQEPLFFSLKRGKKLGIIKTFTPNIGSHELETKAGGAAPSDYDAICFSANSGIVGWDTWLMTRSRHDYQDVETDSVGNFDFRYETLERTS
jgi:hypothetical protein